MTFSSVSCVTDTVHTLLAPHVIYLGRTQRDIGTVGKLHFYTSVDCRAVPCFIATLISMPCGLSDHPCKSFGNYSFQCELRCLQHLSPKMLTQEPVFAQQLCGTGKFSGQRKFYLKRPSYLFFCFSRWQDTMNLS